MCSWLKPPHHSGFRVPFNSAFQVSSPRNGLNHESWGSPKAEFPTNSGLQFSFWRKKHILEYSSICFFLQTQDYISLFGERNIYWNIPVYVSFSKLRIIVLFLEKETYTGIFQYMRSPGVCGDPSNSLNNFYKRTFVSFWAFDLSIINRMSCHQQNCIKKLVLWKFSIRCW